MQLLSHCALWRQSTKAFRYPLSHNVAVQYIANNHQKMVMGLQAHAKLILNSETFKAWTSKSPHPIETSARRAMFDAISNRPADLYPGDDDIGIKGIEYLNSFSCTFSRNTLQCQRLCSVEFTGLETLDYRTIGRSIDRSRSSEIASLQKEVCNFLAFLDLISNDQSILYRESFSDNPIEELEFFKSIVILSTFLVVSLGADGAIDAMSRIYPLFRFSSVASNHPQRLDFIRWTSVGEVAGFKKVAERMLNSRVQKWAALPSYEAPDPSLTKNFLSWLFEPNDSFIIGNPHSYFEDAPGISCVPSHFYALLEYLNRFGFPVAPSITLYGGRDWVRVDRIIPGENYELSPREEEYAQYLQSGKRESPRMTVGEVLRLAKRQQQSDPKSLV